VNECKPLPFTRCRLMTRTTARFVTWRWREREFASSVQGDAFVTPQARALTRPFFSST